MIFVDTGAWFARFVPDDPQHRVLVAWFGANNGPFLPPITASTKR